MSVTVTIELRQDEKTDVFAPKARADAIVIVTQCESGVIGVEEATHKAAAHAIAQVLGASKASVESAAALDDPLPTPA